MIRHSTIVHCNDGDEDVEYDHETLADANEHMRYLKKEHAKGRIPWVSGVSIKEYIERETVRYDFDDAPSNP